MYGNSAVSATAIVGLLVGKYMTFLRHAARSRRKRSPEQHIDLERRGNSTRTPLLSNSTLPSVILTNGSFCCRYGLYMGALFLPLIVLVKVVFPSMRSDDELGAADSRRLLGDLRVLRRGGL